MICKFKKGKLKCAKDKIQSHNILKIAFSSFFAHQEGKPLKHEVDVHSIEVGNEKLPTFATQETISRNDSQINKYDKRQRNGKQRGAIVNKKKRSVEISHNYWRKIDN